MIAVLSVEEELLPEPCGRVNIRANRMRHCQLSESNATETVMLNFTAPKLKSVSSLQVGNVLLNEPTEC